MGITRRTLFKYAAVLPLVGVGASTASEGVIVSADTAGEEPEWTDLPRPAFGVLAYSQESLDRESPRVFRGVHNSDLRVLMMAHGYRESTLKGDLLWIRVPMFLSRWETGPRFEFAGGSSMLFSSQVAAMVGLHGQVSLVKCRDPETFQGVPESILADGPMFHTMGGGFSVDLPRIVEVW